MNQLGPKTLDFLHSEGLSHIQRQNSVKLAHDPSKSIHVRDLSSFVNTQIKGQFASRG